MKSTAGFGLIAVLCGFLASSGWAANVHVSRFWHNHQPIYWPEWNNNGSQNQRVQYAWDSIVLKPSQNYGGISLVQHPENNLNSIFSEDDRKNAYQAGPRNSLNSFSGGGFALSYSGSLIDNVRSLAGAGQLGYGSDWNSGNTQARQSGRLDLVGFTYHHSLAPLLPKEVFRKEVQIFKQAWWKAWGANSDLSDHSKGFFPTEMAFSTELIDVLKDEGYEWVIVASHHLSRTCPTYLQQGTASENRGVKSCPPNRADLLGPSPSTGWWYSDPENTGHGSWNVAPHAYQLHRVQYVNPATGAAKTMYAVPSDDALSYAYGFGNAGIGHIQSKIAPFATDANRPVIVMPSTDGDNAWGGGYDSWMNATPQFFNSASSAGYEKNTPGGFVDAAKAGADNAPIAHIEDGAWIFPVSCYGSPNFLKWIEPPLYNTAINATNRYPGTQVDLETPGFSQKFFHHAPIMSGANWCITAEQILRDEGGDIRPWVIQAPYDWDGSIWNPSPNDVELAWHIYLAGLDSGFTYFGGEGNDDEVKSTLATKRAIDKLSSFMTSRLAKDRTPPTVLKPQRFPYNPGGYTFGWYNRIAGGDERFLKKMPSDFYIWTHAYDVSGIPDGNVVLKIRRDTAGVGGRSLTDTANKTYAGGDGLEDWISIPMTKRVLPKTRSALNTAADNGQIDYFVFDPAFWSNPVIADYYFAKVDGYRDVLLDYYIEATDSLGNVSKSDIQHVYVEDDGTSGGSKPSVSYSPATLTDCAPFTVTFNAATSVLANAATVSALYRYENDEDAWQSAAMTRASSNTFTLTLSAPDNAPFIEICFNDGGSNWENNDGSNWKKTIIDCDAPIWTDGVRLSPITPTAGSSVTVYYDPAGRALSSAANVNIHHGYNGSNWTTAPGVAMTLSDGIWSYTYTIPSAATNIVMCFNNGTTWDNHGGNNWAFEVTAIPPPPPVPDGIVITNPATATYSVADESFTLQGTAGTNLTGNILWTNTATASGGTLTRITEWSLPVSLAVGVNPITVSAAIAGTGGSSGVTTNASDSANGYTSATWISGSNLGSGLGAWILNAGDNAGAFLADSDNANCSVGIPAWGLWANTDDLSEMIRPFATPLAIGDAFSVLMDNNHVDTGAGVGVALQNATGDTLWQFFFNGGDNHYSRSGGTTDIGWTDAGLTIRFELLSATEYEVVITPNGSTARTYTGILETATDQAVARFRAWNYKAGSDANANAYFNDIRITHADESTNEVQYASASVILTRTADGSGDVIQGFSTLSGSPWSFQLNQTLSTHLYGVFGNTNLLEEPQRWFQIGDAVLGTDGDLLLTIPEQTNASLFFRVDYTNSPTGP